MKTTYLGLSKYATIRKGATNYAQLEKYLNE